MRQRILVYEKQMHGNLRTLHTWRARWDEEPIFFPDFWITLKGHHHAHLKMYVVNQRVNFFFQFHAKIGMKMLTVKI